MPAAERVIFVMKAWLAFAAGCGLSLVPAVLHGLTIGWDAYIHAAIGFSVTRASPASQPFTRFMANGALSLGVFLLENLVVITALGGRLLLPGARRPVASEGFVWLWLATTVIGMAAGGSWWLHYYVQAVPPLAVLIAIAVFRAVGALRRDLPSLLWTGLNLGASVHLVIVQLQPPLPFYLAETNEVAAYLAEHTTPEERIHVAGSDPQIYFLARRRSAHPYLFLGKPELPRVPEAIDELVALLDDPLRRPAYVVVPPGGQIEGYGLEPFFSAVERNYRLEHQIGRVLLYRKSA
jgi:hypothetical protein